MTRGNQREIDRARAQARQAKNGGKGKDGDTNKDRLTKLLTDADIMREKQKKAEMKRMGIVEEEEKPKKQIDLSYLKQYEGLDLGEEGEEESKN
mmetsp:Transcript_17644/g.29806  ORF Transcript_17644/g.29806 Transcript_17644/m.29806 type:complete len:94 (-) Transcript_17644:112-393(-)